ncbi:delta endotoxin-like protein [Nitrosomonas oligotropha]|uniref:Delta endotoxin-like protein n=1 Tax=Nitrosomonas oligotropha TaxID=42354 RepID=A0A2T5I4X9_9PROT|nr:insecticidal delta-endotoxin Cry8Ea1 family protein [Nitrosomonas oligotropha]PTQ78880.1 delta endotoxin-like protein [Nitrosomonas oligotropha]
MSSDQNNMDFNNTMKEVTVGVVGLIPEVGGLISFMITQFWPDSSQNIFDSIKDQVKGLINQAILKKEIEDIEANLEALHSELETFRDTEGDEKMVASVNAYSKADEIRIKITRSSNNIHLIRYMVALSQLHLGILRERLNHGTEIYHQKKNPTWESDLKTAYDKYYQFFNDIFTDWLWWRVSLIKVNSHITNDQFYNYNYCKVIDDLTGVNRSFDDLVSKKEVNNQISQHLGNSFAERIRNEAILEMAGVLLSTFTLNRFLPGRENEAPIVNDHLKVLYWGPYGSFIDPKLVDKPGKITEIRIRAGSWIDGFQFIYADHEGHFIGKPTGGTPYPPIASSDTSPVRGIKMRFSPSPDLLSEFHLITQLEFICSDSDGKNKKTIGPFGNQMGWGGTDYDTTSMIDPEYCLRGGSFGGNFAMGSIKEDFCITAIRLEYHHSSLPLDRSLAPYWNRWRHFGGHFSELASAVKRNGWVEVYTIGIGNYNSVYHIRRTTPGDKWSSDWGSLDGHFSELATVVMRNGCVEIFAIGTGESNRLYHIWENIDGTWSKWTHLFDGHFSKLATAVNEHGFIEVFAIGAGKDNRMYHIWKNPDGAWMNGTNLFEGHFSKLATAVKPDGSIEVFAIGAGEDNRMYHIGKTPGGTWSNWECLDGHFSELATAVNADGRIEVFAIGTGENNGLYHIWQTTPGSTWSSWECLGGHFSELATAVNADGCIEVFAIGTGENNGLYHIWQTTPGSTWSSWDCISDGHFSKLVAAVSADRIEVFVIGAGDNNGVSHIWRPNYR